MTNEQREILRDRYRGCMLGLAIGDALGMPVETMTPEEILAATHGLGVTGFLSPIQRTFHETAELQPGQWTDDTQLSLAIARSFVRLRAFDLADIASEHAAAFRRRHTRGWGDSTRIGIQELIEGVRRVGEPVRDPKALGMGNGVAMKIAPLALATAPIVVSRTSSDSAFRTFAAQVIDVASLTHRDPCAAIGAQLIGMLIHAALAMPKPARIPPVWLLLTLFSCAHCTEHPLEFARRIREIPKTADVAAVAALTGTRCTVYESVTLVIGAVYHHWMDFRSGVLAAVNQGGDADSTGSMVGAVLGALHGASAIPEEWRGGVEDAEEIVRLADQLFEYALQNGTA